MPLVTVITAAYNLIKCGRKDTFRQTVESVQCQTYKNIEHIVIDGASNDGTIDLLKEYQEKGQIKYYSEPDSGLYDAINKGILKANGKYVVVLNSDDFYCDEHAIEWLVDKIEENNADACYADAVIVNQKTLEIIKDWKGREAFLPWCGCWPCHQTFLIKTDVMKELGLYNLKYKCSADNNFFMRMFQNGKKFVCVDKRIIFFRDGGFSDSHYKISEQDQIDGWFEEYGQYHGWTHDEVSQFIHRKFMDLPVEKAINLGMKLENKEWMEQFFNVFMQKYVCLQKKNIKQNEKNTYYLFDIIPLLKTRLKYGVKRYLLCGFLPVLKVKYNNEKIKSYLFSVIPLTYMSEQHGVCKFRILGIPLLKIKD